MRFIILGFIVFGSQAVYCQPYLDLVHIRYQNSPDAGAWRRENKSNHFHYFNISLNYPLIFKKDSSMIVVSPFSDGWAINIQSFPDLPGAMQSLALPLSFVKPLSKRWTISNNDNSPVERVSTKNV